MDRAEELHRKMTLTVVDMLRRRQELEATIQAAL
jgi:hypothetical protein